MSCDDEGVSHLSFGDHYGKRNGLAAQDRGGHANAISTRSVPKATIGMYSSPSVRGGALTRVAGMTAVVIEVPIPIVPWRLSTREP